MKPNSRINPALADAAIQVDIINLGGTTTRAAAEKMKADFERADRKNPWTRGTTKFEIRSANNL